MDVIDEVNRALDEEKMQVIAQVAPSVRVSIGEEFGFSPGTILTNVFVGALKQAGFERVFDTSTAADIVTVEEGTEFIRRLNTKESLPLFTSCCPGSVAFIEKNFPKYVYNFCTVKSPQQTMGALIKTYYARRMKLRRKDIYSVSIMPCFVKRIEAKRPEMEFDGIPHVDAVLTTREIAKLLKGRGIKLEESKVAGFDYLLGEASGAGQLFGATGGVTEALLRFVSKELGSKPERIEFREIRGKGGFREAEIEIAGNKLKVALVHGLHNLSDLISNEKRFKQYQIIELMVCPGGCIGGGGQPISTPEILEKRRKAMIKVDRQDDIRVSSENPEVKELYAEYLLEPGSRVAHSLLHAARICLKCD